MKKIALLAVVFLLTTFSAFSKNYRVSVKTDAGIGSLRAYIDSANIHAGLDTITLNLTTSDTIYLQTALDTITDSLWITGLPCSNPTISGINGPFAGSAIYVAGATVPLSVSYVNFANCVNLSNFAQGGVICANIVNLNNCFFHDNAAFDNSGIDVCAGGAIFATHLAAINCSFSNNVAGDNPDYSNGIGGAAFADSTINLYNCTFYGNSADGAGSAIFANNIIQGNIINCTVANNGPVVNGDVEGAVYITSNTLGLNIANNIFWGNAAVEGNPEIVSENGIVSGGCNILEFGADYNFTTVAGDYQGIDPLLGTYDYHGGCVPVVVFGCGSIAQNHATCSGATTFDARGISASGVRDAGAFELPEYVPHLGPNINQCGGSVNLQATPVTPINSYLWSTGQTTDAITVSTSGYYHILVSDTFGCYATDSFWVYIKPAPVVNLGPAVTRCGGADTLNALNPGDLYHWNTGATTQKLIVTTNANYTVTVTDPNSSCSASAGATISFNTLPVVNLGPNVNQCGGSATLDAGNNGDTFQWSDGTFNEQTVATTSGTYIVTVTDPETGCSASGSVQVYIQGLPYVNLGNDTVQCGGSVTLQAGNPGDLYLWSNGATTAFIVVTDSNTYSVTVTDPNGGCSAADTVSVNVKALPVVNLGPDVTQCGGTVTLYAGNAGSTFVWSTGSTADSIITTTPGLYSVVVTNTAGCSAADSVNVYLQTVPSVYLGQDVRQCGGSVTLDAGNPQGFSYFWINESNTQTIVVSTSGLYSVTVTSNINGCSTTDSINVVIDTIPVVNLGPDTTQCGGVITLNAGNAVSTYLWSNDSTQQTVTVSASGIYRVTVTNGNGCTATGSIGVTINPVPVVTLALPANVCMTDAPFLLVGGNPVGGTYFEADTAISIFSPNGQGIGAHEITYVFTNNFGCVDSDSASIFVRPQPSITTIPAPYLCTTSADLNLNNYFNPPGGFYSGVGVSADLFYPNLVPAGMDTITDVYTDNYGCKDTSKYLVRIHPPVHVRMTSSVADFTICKGQPITFIATGAELYQYFVNDSAVGPPVTDSSFTSATLGNHSIVHVVGSNPCSTDTSEPIVIDVIIPPVVSAGSDTTITLGQTVELHGVATGNGNLTYLWIPGNSLNFIDVPNPTYSGSDTITFTLKATDSYGCADSAKVTVNVYVPDNILLPTVITPNGDGYNDVWKLNSKINLDGSHLIVFDRWGQTVYETDNYANNWGGTFKGTGNVLPDDTYYFVLKVPALHNHVYEGPINIISGSVK